MIELLIAILGTYGVAVLVSEYDGLFSIFAKARRSFLRPLLVCSVCFAVWVAIAFSIALNLSLLEYLAVLGGAVLLARNL